MFFFDFTFNCYILKRRKLCRNVRANRMNYGETFDVLNLVNWWSADTTHRLSFIFLIYVNLTAIRVYRKSVYQILYIKSSSLSFRKKIRNIHVLHLHFYYSWLILTRGNVSAWKEISWIILDIHRASTTISLIRSVFVVVSCFGYDDLVA